jgi:hypothetical protein
VYQTLTHTRLGLLQDADGERELPPGCGFTSMKPRLIDDAQHWRDRAEEVRTQAEHMNNAEARMMMRGIAESYEKLARLPSSAPKNRKIDQPEESSAPALAVRLFVEARSAPPPPSVRRRNGSPVCANRWSERWGPQPAIPVGAFPLSEEREVDSPFRQRPSDGSPPV